MVELSKEYNLLEAIKLHPNGYQVYEELEKIMKRTGANENQVNKVLEPYNERITSEKGLTPIEVSIIATKIQRIAKKKK